MRPHVLILHANGTNRDHELAQAFELAGARAEIIHLNHLRSQKISWQNYQILAIPGGFSYGDTLGAGRILALDLKTYFAEEVQNFVSSGKPVIGICNGFQALIKTGLLPDNRKQATLTFNNHGKFECRWVTLQTQSKKCLWTNKLTESIYCPVAHGEGRFTLNSPELLTELKTQDQLAFCYADSTGMATNQYPLNPNGSLANIAGISNQQGNVLGMMPHPEDHILPHQHPRWTRGECGNMGLQLFKNGVNYVL